MSEVANAKERLRELVMAIIDELSKDDYNIALFKSIIQGYVDFYMKMITDEQALKIMVKLDQICNTIRRARGGRRGRGD
jgi:hypothetical protein